MGDRGSSIEPTKDRSPEVPPPVEPAQVEDNAYGDGATAVPRASRQAWVQWLLAFVGFVLPIAAWSLATPEFASPDEISHAYRAVSVVRGEFLPQADSALGGGAGTVSVPKGYAAAADSIGCYVFDGKVTADCAQDVQPSEELEPRSSGAARYNPFYYLLVGWPTLLSTGGAGYFGMRLVSAALAAGFLASGFVSAWRGRQSRLWRGAVVLAGTPMVFFMAAVCNPNGLEIAAAISVWAALLRLLTGTAWSSGETGALLRRFAIGSSALVLTRGLSPLWLAIIGLTCLAVADLPRVARLLRSARTWVWIGLVLLATAGSVGWTLAAGTSNIPDLYAEPDKTFLGAITYEWGFMGGRLQQFFGLFGWTDTPSPALAIMLFTLALGGLVILALALGRTRPMIVLLALGAIVIGLPLALEAMQFNELGLFWQSRYTLPIAVGIPLLAAYALTERGTLAGSSAGHVLRTRRLAVIITAAVAIAHIMSFSNAIIRYSAGLDNTLSPFVGTWHPVGGVALVHVLQVAGLGLLVWLVGWAGRNDDREIPRGISAGGAPAPETGRSSAPAESGQFTH